MRRCLIVVVLIPFCVFGLDEFSWGVYKDTDHKITYAVHRAKCDDKSSPYHNQLWDLYEGFAGMLREYTYYKYVFIVLTVINDYRYTIRWDDDYDKILLEINKDGKKYKLESKNYADKYLNDYMVVQMQNLWLSNRNILDKGYWDMRFGSEAYMYPTIDSRTRGTTQKMIGFDKSFSWYDVEQIWLKRDDKIYEMEIIHSKDMK